MGERFTVVESWFPQRSNSRVAGPDWIRCKNTSGNYVSDRYESERDGGYICSRKSSHLRALREPIDIFHLGHILLHDFLLF